MADMFIKFKCTNCGKTIRAKRVFRGKKGKCPACKMILVIPMYEINGHGDETDEPGAKEPSEAPAQAKSSIPDLKGKKVLVVDDDKDFLKLMTLRLKPTGCQLIFASDAMSATMVSSKERPDIIFLDIGLPAGGSGFLVLERLINDVGIQGPIIVISSWSPATAKKRVLDAGAVAFLQKTASIEEIFNAIREALE